MKKSKKMKKQEKKLLKKQAKLEKKSVKLQKKLNKLQSKDKTETSVDKKKFENIIKLANGTTVKNPVKPDSQKKSLHFKDLNKKKKRGQKNFNKVRKIVKEAFPDLEEKGMNTMINSLTHGVRLNKAFIDMDEKTRKNWEEMYINELFTEFKQLIEKYNKNYTFKADDLQSKIEERQRLLTLLTTEVKTLEKRKADLEKTVAE
jgi:hypothetical protein